MQGGRGVAKQLDCRTSIVCTQNNGVHGVRVGPHTPFSRLSHYARIPKPGLNDTSGMDCPTNILNYSNQHIPYQSSSQNSISSFAIMVALWMTHIASEQYFTGISSNVSSSFGHISHCKCISILNQCTLLTLRVIQSTMI
jgi:hypothetical protein